MKVAILQRSILCACAFLAIDMITLAFTQNPELVMQTGHEGPIQSVVFSPDGRALATGGSDNLVKIWDVATRMEVQSLKGHTAPIRSVAFSPDGNTLASGSRDKTVRLWDLTRLNAPRTLVGHTSYVTAVAFSPRGQTLVTSGTEIIIWQVASGRKVRTIDAGTWVSSMALSLDGKKLVGVSYATANIWSTEDGVKLWSLPSPSAESVAFSPDGKLIAVGTENNSYIELREAATGRIIN